MLWNPGRNALESSNRCSIAHQALGWFSLQAKLGLAPGGPRRNSFPLEHLEPRQRVVGRTVALLAGSILRNRWFCLCFKLLVSPWNTYLAGCTPSTSSRYTVFPPPLPTALLGQLLLHWKSSPIGVWRWATLLQHLRRLTPDDIRHALRHHSSADILLNHRQAADLTDWRRLFGSM